MNFRTTTDNPEKFHGVITMVAVGQSFSSLKYKALVWLLTAACIETGRPQTANGAIEQVEQRLSKDGWPEYYDGKAGRYIRK
ncbi:cytosolic invertase 2 [Prunus dulcis]|uniref:Cytosolic invertase 2 n=1 Tax=Prunus dulcis TaxID=3755 RepID=A0A4Y1RCL9_PRUDU|nr:cytosolic invertase 2 [Prunus dulcis]